jgi:hypothetical protein
MRGSLKVKRRNAVKREGFHRGEMIINFRLLFKGGRALQKNSERERENRVQKFTQEVHLK